METDQLFQIVSFSASRAKLSAVNSISKLRGTAKHTLYPQPEGLLGECMVKYGKELGDEAPFGKIIRNKYALKSISCKLNTHLPYPPMVMCSVITRPNF